MSIQKLVEIDRALVVLISALQDVLNITKDLNINPHPPLISTSESIHISKQDLLVHAKKCTAPLSSVLLDMKILYTAINKNCNALTPINSLPDHILVKIFKAIPYDVATETYQVANLVLVSSICKRWRDLAIHTGSLWTTIQFPNRRRSGKIHYSIERLCELEGAFHLARLCLARSGDCGLRILFNPWLKLSLISSVVDVVLPAVMRWEHIVLGEFGSSDVIPSFLDECSKRPTEKPRLKSLDITLHGTRRDSEWGFYALAAAAPLRSLTLKHNQIPHSSTIYTNLTHLAFHSASYRGSNLSQLDMVLRDCKKLRSLILVVDGAGYVASSGPSKIVLPDLEEITLDCRLTDPLSIHILQNLISPSLRRFSACTCRYSQNEWQATDDHSAMISFLSSTPSIRVFRFTELPPTRIHEFLGAIPNLETLIIGDSASETKYPQDPQFIPSEICSKLTELRIEGPLQNKTGIPRLMEFIRARIASPDVAPIRALTFSYISPNECHLYEMWRSHPEFSAMVDDLVWDIHREVEAPRYY